MHAHEPRVSTQTTVIDWSGSACRRPSPRGAWTTSGLLEARRPAVPSPVGRRWNDLLRMRALPPAARGKAAQKRRRPPRGYPGGLITRITAREKAALGTLPILEAPDGGANPHRAGIPTARKRMARRTRRWPCCQGQLGFALDLRRGQHGYGPLDGRGRPEIHCVTRLLRTVKKQSAIVRITQLPKSHPSRDEGAAPGRTDTQPRCPSPRLRSAPFPT